MIAALIYSPWASPGEPKIESDFPLDSCELRLPKISKGSFTTPGLPGVTQTPLPKDGAPVEIRCSHEVWEAIVESGRYTRVYWYQEDGKERRYMSG